jgi:predicted MFS family arabinose efflux permease
VQASRQLKILILIQLLTGFSLMALPFYVVFAKRELHAPASALGFFLLAQVVGGVLSNLRWARLVDRLGSRKMLAICASLSTLTPLIAMFGARWGWQGILPAIFVGGAAFSGRKVGFQTALLEIAPAAQRPTFSATNRSLVIPVAFLPLVAGYWLKHASYNSLFVVCALFLAAGAALAWRWSRSAKLH